MVYIYVGCYAVAAVVGFDLPCCDYWYMEFVCGAFCLICWVWLFAVLCMVFCVAGYLVGGVLFLADVALLLAAIAMRCFCECVD